MKMRLLYLLGITFCFLLNQNLLAQSCTTDAEFTGSQSLERTITSSEVSGQSFQAISSGALQAVSIDLSADNQGCVLNTIDLQIDILDGDGTGGNVLTSQTYSLPADITRNMETFTFSSPASVTATQMYTIVLSLASGQDCGSGDEPNLIWYYEFPTNYWDNTGGTQYFGSNIASLGNTQYFSTCVGCINVTGEETYTGCEGDGYEVIVNGNTYDEDTPTGTETLIEAAANGCDSIVTINLTFLPTATGEETYTGCANDGYEVIVNGTTYDEANPTGTETFAGQAANGCDSIVTINLTFLSNITGTDVITACGSFEWIDGVTYTESNNTATFTIPSSAGCDSLVLLNLTIQPALITTVTEVVNSNGMLVLIADQPSGTYQWVDCDNNFEPITNANNRTFLPQVNGNYAVELSNGLCTETSACVNINSLSAEVFKKQVVRVYPNPTKDIVNVETAGSEGMIEVVDALGRSMGTTQIKSEVTTINLSEFNKGVYLLRIIQQNETYTIRVVLK
jgi:hypothetical protein